MSLAAQAAKADKADTHTQLTHTHTVSSPSLHTYSCSLRSSATHKPRFGLSSQPESAPGPLLQEVRLLAIACAASSFSLSSPSCCCCFFHSLGPSAPTAHKHISCQIAPLLEIALCRCCLVQLWFQSTVLQLWHINTKSCNSNCKSVWAGKHLQHDAKDMDSIGELHGEILSERENCAASRPKDVLSEWGSYAW